jgi:hypothetical protein
VGRTTKHQKVRVVSRFQLQYLAQSTSLASSWQVPHSHAYPWPSGENDRVFKPCLLQNLSSLAHTHSFCRRWKGFPEEGLRERPLAALYCTAHSILFCLLTCICHSYSPHLNFAPKGPPKQNVLQLVLKLGVMKSVRTSASQEQAGLRHPPP